MNDGFRIGIDLGGTKIECVVMDPAGSVCWRRRIRTPRGNYDETIAALARLVAAARPASGDPAPVGIGIPGSVSARTGRVKHGNATWLIGRPLQRDIEAALGVPVRIENDANCLAVSEAADGAGSGDSVILAVVLGTGIGAGLVVNGHPVSGANAIAGEWGHNPLPWPEDSERPGDACYCGRSGCLETWLSGPALARRHCRETGQTLEPREIARRAGAGDPAASRTLDAWINRLARSLATVINLLDPDVIVVGGGLSNISRLYSDVPKQWQRYVFSDEIRTRLVAAAHGDASGVRGAAWLWPRHPDGSG